MLALYLEHLEFALYSGGYAAFSEEQYQADGFPPGFRDNVAVIASYFLSVGIGAYLGGALELTDNPTLLSTASSILTVEARHDSYLRTGLGASPFPNPFDTSLTALFAYSLAQLFIVRCPMQLPITPTPKLNLTSPMPPLNLQPPTPAGTNLTFSWDPSTFFTPVPADAPLYIAIINQIAPPIFQKVTKTSNNTGVVPVPQGAAGVAFAVLTAFSGNLTEMQLSSFGTLAGPAEVVLG
ncbi:MAG: hypothetical protein Q9227_001395 [Pyrenula ochraceoflavens]